MSAPIYPTGTSYTVVIENERKLREDVEDRLDRRLHAVEERLFIAEMNPDWDTVTYPELMEAFNKFKEEELKMMTFEALRNSK